MSKGFGEGLYYFTDSEATHNYREHVELIQSRLSLLHGREEMIMSLHYIHNMSFERIGKLVGLHGATVGRMVRRISRMLIEGVYLRCIQNRELFSQEELAVAYDKFICGLGQREIAARYCIGIHFAARLIKSIEARAGI